MFRWWFAWKKDEAVRHMEILNPRHMRKKSDINYLNSHSDVNQREIPLASDILGFIIQSLTSDFHSGFFLFKKIKS